MLLTVRCSIDLSLSESMPRRPFGNIFGAIIQFQRNYPTLFPSLAFPPHLALGEILYRLSKVNYLRQRIQISSPERKALEEKAPCSENGGDEG